MKIAVGVIDAVLGTVALTPRGLEIDGPEKETLEHLVQDFRTTGLDDQEVLQRMLARLQGYTWAAEINEDEPGRAADPGSRPATPRGAAGGIQLSPLEIDDSWLDAVA
jgi:hypothetical protein